MQELKHGSQLEGGSGTAASHSPSIPPEHPPVGTAEADGSKHRLLMGIAGLAGLLVFISTIGHGFIFDDNLELRGFDGLFTPGGWLALLSRQQSHLYRPLKNLTFHCDYLLWGWNPIGFHLTNVLLHALVCALVASALLALGRTRAGALAGALWFAVHPIHTEAVAWVTARGALLSAVGVLGATVAFTRWWRCGRTRDLGLLAAASTLAFFSKEDSLLLVPALLAVAAWGNLDGASETGNHRRRLEWGLAASLLPALLYLAIRHTLLPDMRQGTWEHGLQGLIATLPGILLRYFFQLLVPLDLVLEPPVNYAQGLGWQFWGALLLISIGPALMLLRGTRWNTAKLAVAWFGLFLLPALGFIPINAPAADRFLYTPSFAGALLVAAGWEVLSKSRLDVRRPLSFGVCLACLILAVQTVGYSEVWRSDATLWRYVLRQNPHSFRAWTNLASEANNRGQFREALALSEKALALRPEHVEAHVTRAYALDRLERLDAAERAYRQALQGNEEPTTLYLLADLLERKHRLAEAAKLYDRVLKQRPGFVDARIAAGVLAIRLGHRREAIDHWEVALRYDPRNQLARRNLSQVRESTFTQ